MKQTLFFTILYLTAWSNQAIAQDTSIFPKGEKSPNVHHTGNVWLNELNASDSTFNYSIALATFDPEARLDWHTPWWSNPADYCRHRLLPGKRQAKTNPA